jgi:membrane-bound metal-dependent hydrolase YbcI (DUF457 family)
MDNVTHTLFAATLARTPLGRAGRGTTAALIIASNLPDIDIITTAGGAASYLQWHRGPTHGPIGIVGLGILTAALVRLAYRFVPQLKKNNAGGAAGATVSPVASFAMLAIVSTIGALLHVLMDLPTTYGVRALSPFSWRWFAVDWMPIVDIYLLIVLLSGLMFGLRSSTARRSNAAIVLTLMAAIYGIRAAAHHQALVVAPRLLGPTLPPLCDPAAVPLGVIDVWPRATIKMPELPAGKRCLVEMVAIPDFTGPFSWRIVAQMSNAYEIYQVDLLDSRLRQPETAGEVFWRDVRRYPNIWTPVVEQAAASRIGQIFLGFSRFPAARTVVDAQGLTTVRWTDVRFVFGVGLADRPRGGPDMFTATVRVGPNGEILDERLGAR